MTISLKTPKADHTPPTKKPNRARHARRIYSAVFALVVVGLACGGVYVLYAHLSAVVVPARTATTNVSPGAPTAAPVALTTNDPKQVVDRVSKLMLVPSETPVVAVVSDLSKLKGQLFFANAEEGDVVLMFPHAQKAVLYSPSLNKIIEVAPITNNTQK